MSHLDVNRLDDLNGSRYDPTLLEGISNGNYKGSYADISKVRLSLTDQLRAIDIALFHNVDLAVPGYSVIVFPSDLEPQGQPFMKACLMYHDEPCSASANDLPVEVLTRYALVKTRLASWVDGVLPILSFEGFEVTA